MERNIISSVNTEVEGYITKMVAIVKMMLDFVKHGETVSQKRPIFSRKAENLMISTAVRTNNKI